MRYTRRMDELDELFRFYGIEGPLQARMPSSWLAVEDVP